MGPRHKVKGPEDSKEQSLRVSTLTLADCEDLAPEIDLKRCKKIKNKADSSASSSVLFTSAACFCVRDQQQK